MELFNVYSLYPIEPVRGKGCYVYDAAGTLAGKGIAHGHHRAQQHGNAQNDTNDPQ